MDNETPRRPSRRVLAAVALFAAGGIAGAALGLSGGAVAQTPNPTESTAPGEQAPDQPKPDGMRGKGGRGKGPGGPGRHGKHGIRGEFVVPKAGGGYQTMTTQNGQVTAVSPTSIAVRSEDGHTATYVVTAETLVNSARDGISTVAVGDAVHVAGVREGDRITAIRIVDRTKVEANRDRFAPRPRPSASAAA